MVGRGFGNHTEGPEVTKQGVYLCAAMARHFHEGISWGCIPHGSIVRHSRIVDTVKHCERLHKKAFSVSLVYH